MNGKLFAAAAALSLLTACAQVPSAADMQEARYGKVVTATNTDGARQRVVVRMADGSTIDVTQDREPGIMVGDVVRVFGSGSGARVQRL